MLMLLRMHSLMLDIVERIGHDIQHKHRIGARSVRSLVMRFLMISIITHAVRVER